MHNLTLEILCDIVKNEKSVLRIIMLILADALFLF